LVVVVERLGLRLGLADDEGDGYDYDESAVCLLLVIAFQG
jgi:hypothetical protein